MTLEKALARRRRLRAALAAAGSRTGRPAEAQTGVEEVLPLVDRLLAEFHALDVWIAKTAAATILADGRTLAEALAEQRRLRLRLVFLRRLRQQAPRQAAQAIRATLAESAGLRRLIRTAGRVELSDYSVIPTFLQAVLP